LTQQLAKTPDAGQAAGDLQGLARAKLAELRHTIDLKRAGKDGRPSQ
jgi:hypothetical protein